MASPGGTSSGGIPRLLYSESVHTPLIHEGHVQYGVVGTGASSGGMSSDSAPRNYSEALNPGYIDDNSETGNGTVEIPSSPISPRAVDESGTIISPRRVLSRSTEVPGFHEFVPYLRDSNRTKYEEAALFVKEGEQNDKFASHPNGRYSKIAYHLFHHPVCYMIDFIASCLLLSLAIIETPSLIPYPANYEGIIVGVHALFELIFLTVIGFNIILRFIWMKPKTFLRQRAMISAVVMLLMYIEAMVVIVRQKNHFRITRCLRIVFFIDSYIMVGMRRVLRQIFQCLKPILDVMILLFFMIAVFALMGYYLFAESDPTFFDSYLKAFVSLFITLTTANHPDVYMEAYFNNHLSPIFFITYLFVTLYFFSNVLLAVVYSNFNDEEKDKFRKLFLHKREALRLAYYILAKDGEGVNYHDFLLFMLQYKPRTPEYQVMCIFKGLQRDETMSHDTLCLEDFYSFYEIQNLKWKQVKGDGHTVAWYDEFPIRVRPVFAFFHKIIRFHYFNSIMAFIVQINALFLILHTFITSLYCSKDGADNIENAPDSYSRYCGEGRFIASHNSIYGSFVFTIIYLVEITIRLLAVGPIEYFRKWWNRFDFIIILSSFILLCVELDAGVHHPTLHYLIVFRPVKLLRLLRLRRRYYDIMNTVFILGHRLLSVLLLLFVIYYFFAIIGMEIFQGRVYVGCCETALYQVGSYYTSNGTPSSSQVYWLNNFDNIYQSYIILYEEMVVNNWFVQMEGFVSETNIYARFFFISFWVTTTICLSVVIAYIVDAFVFRIQDSKKKKKCKVHSSMFECNCHEYRKKRVLVSLKGSEINQIKYETTLIDETNRTRRKSPTFNSILRNLKRIDFDLIPSREVKFSGKRLRTRDDLNLEMYRGELQEWIDKRDKQLRLLQDSPYKEKAFKTVLWEKTKGFLLFLLE